MAGESVAAHQTLSGEDTHWFFLHPADRAGVASMRWERTERFVFPLQQQIKQDCGWSFCSAWPECDSLSCGTSPPIYEYGNVSHFNGPHRLHYFVPFWLMTNQSSLQRSPHTHFILGFRPVVVMLPLFSGDTEGESTKFSYTSLSMTHVSDMLYNERKRKEQLEYNNKTFLLSAEIFIYVAALHPSFNISVINETVCAGFLSTVYFY